MGIVAGLRVRGARDVVSNLKTGERTIIVPVCLACIGRTVHVEDVLGLASHIRVLVEGIKIARAKGHAGAKRREIVVRARNRMLPGRGVDGRGSSHRVYRIVLGGQSTDAAAQIH